MHAEWTLIRNVTKIGTRRKEKKGGVKGVVDGLSQSGRRWVASVSAC
jgi:hypothetical protein